MVVLSSLMAVPRVRACEGEHYTEYDSWVEGTDFYDTDTESCIVYHWVEKEYDCWSTSSEGSFGVTCSEVGSSNWDDVSCTPISGGGGDPDPDPDDEDPDQCTNGNAFRIYDGNAHRQVIDLSVVSAAGSRLAWARYHNTVPNRGRVYLGQGGGWRHNWQFDLIEFPQKSGEPFIQTINPSGQRRTFVPAGAGIWSPEGSAFREKIEATSTGYDLVLESGARWHFHRVPEANGISRFEMRSVAHSRGSTTTLNYDARGNLVKVTDPFGRSLTVSYDDVAVNSASWQRFGTVKGTPVAGRWVEFEVPAALKAQGFRTLRLISARSGVALGVAEVEFYAPGAAKPLSGVVKGTGGNAAAAFDGDATSSFFSERKAVGLVAVELASPSAVARVRVLPAVGAEATLAGAKLEGLLLVPEVRSFITAVKGSDGAEVRYAYDVSANPLTGQEHAVLSGARYGDGTSANYKYSYENADKKPLLVEADDPRYNGKAKRIRYAYHDNAEAGMIRQEINPVTGGAYVTLNLDPKNPDARIVEFTDLRTKRYTIPQNTNGRATEIVDSLGRKTQRTFADGGKGRLLTLSDHRGRVTTLAHDAAAGVVRQQRADVQLSAVKRDAKGRVLERTDRRGRTSRFTRDERGAIRSVELPNGRSFAVTHDARGWVDSITEAGRGTHRFTYDERGLKTAWTKPDGTRITYSYDQRDRLVAYTDALGRTFRRDLNDRGLPVKFVNPDGTTRTVTYDAYGRKTAATDALGRTNRYAYDELGRVTRHEDAYGRVTAYDYTELPQGCGSCTLTPTPSRIVGPDGVATSFLYDTEGRLLARTVAQGTAVEATTVYAYDEDNNVTAVTDPEGRVTRYTYDSDGHRLTATDPVGRVTEWAYDAEGRNTSITGPDGGVTRFEYDAADRVVAQTDAAGNTTRTAYNAEGKPVAVTDALGRVTRFAYDAAGRLISTRHPDGTTATREYDAAGRLTREVSGDGLETVRAYNAANVVVEQRQSASGVASRAVKFAYDTLNRLVSSTDPLGGTTRRDYDAAGNLTALTLPDGAKTTKTFDSQGRPRSMTDANGNTTQFAYDVAGNLVALTDARGQTYRLTYDALRRRTSIVYPDNSRESWTYTLVGQLASYTTRAGQVKTVSYDSAGRPIRETWAPAGAAPDVSYTYSPEGRLSGIDNTNVKLSYAYDALGRVASEKIDLSPLVPGLASHTVGYAFDALGRPASMDYPGQTKIRLGYDARDRLATIGDGSGQPIARYTYDAFGRIGSVRRENNVDTAYTYDSAGRLLDIEHAKNGTVLTRSSYALDTVGRRVTQTREDGVTERYSYDAAGQLTAVDYGSGRMETFAYDAAGNRQRSTDSSAATVEQIDYVTNALNQYTRVGAGTFTYDGNGNLAGDGQQRYRYDAQNRLVAVESSTIRTELYYDARNRCVLRKYFAKSANGSWTLNAADSRVLTYDTRWNLLTERTLDGRAAGQYVHGSRTDEVLQWTGSDGAKLYPLADGLGSTVALVDRQSRVVERCRYAAFGEPSASSAAHKSADGIYRFRFSGREWLSQLGLSEHRNRYTNPKIGRWLSTDPLRFQDGANIYAYVLNEPIGKSDPSGLRTCTTPQYEPCMQDSEREFADCMTAASEAFNNCKNAADTAMSGCKAACSYLSCGPLITACEWGCEGVFGGAMSLCYAARLGLQSGCGNNGLIHQTYCVLNYQYQVDDGQPCNPGDY